MVTLNGLQVNKTTDNQSPLVLLSQINHSEDTLGENLSRLQKDGLITPLYLLIDAKRWQHRKRHVPFSPRRCTKTTMAQSYRSLNGCSEPTVQWRCPEKIMLWRGQRR